MESESLCQSDSSSSSSSSKKLKHSYEDALVQGLLVPSTAADPELMNTIPQTLLKDSANYSEHGPENDLEHGSENSDDVDDEASYYDSDELLYEEDFSSYNETLSLQAQFDAADLPSGVEAPIPWLEESSKSQTSTVSGSSSSRKEDDEVLKRFKSFKRFDMVEDSSDHYYYKQGSKPKQASGDWTKTIHYEWSILEKNLPDTIFVRVYEERMDLLRAVIVGAAGTPYHDGLFFFDLIFPLDYPKVPPLVHYHSGGLRLNPNLYACGKVCLSLLNTWQGRESEKWTPGKSTIFQVLLSIQALVLNEKPYFNEPGYERSAGKTEGERQAVMYNENTFVLSLRTMLYTLRKPPKHFEDLVAGHFRERAETILEACKAYIKGAQVGCLIENEEQTVEEVDVYNARKYLKDLRDIVGNLVPALIRNGAKDCDRYIPLGDINRTAPLKI